MLSNFPLFADLPDDILQILQSTSEACQCQPGEILFTEGTFSEYFYLVLEGKIQIVKSLGSEDERAIAVSKGGSILGEMEIFSEEGTHTASARALTQVNLIKISIKQFASTVQTCPQFAYNLLRLFTRRLQRSENLTIKDLREKNRKLAKAYHDLKIAQAAIIEKEKLEHELQLAGEMQRSILPKERPSYPGLDFGALIIPARQVGGDFYDFIHLDDSHIGIVIGDVCDKGMPAALFMALSYSSIRTEALRNENPSKTLLAVNKHLLQINSTEMFVTVLYGILDCNTREFTYARAGHPLPLLLDGNYQPVKIPQNFGQAIGLFDSIQLDEGQFILPKDGTLLIFSDGLSESIDESLKSPKLPSLCANFFKKEEKSSQNLCEHLFKISVGSLQHSQLRDDFTVVGIRHIS